MGGKIQIFTISCWISRTIHIYKRSLNQNHVKEKLSLFFFLSVIRWLKKIILPVDICFFLREPSPMSGAPDPNEICLCNCLRFGSGLRIGFFSAVRKIDQLFRKLKKSTSTSNLHWQNKNLAPSISKLEKSSQMKSRCSSLYKKDNWTLLYTMFKVYTCSIITALKY
jgi:hypothetical protein